MKGLKVFLLIAAAAVLALGLNSTADAFHAGGVAECVGCHSMHNPASGALLTMGDVSSTCLNCHESSRASSYHISTAETAMPAGTPPGNRTPGGDFGWIKKDYSWNPGWGAQNEDGDHHGHNIIATDFSYAKDAHNATNAPGGTFASGNLHCNSCHDQHGKARRLSDGSFASTGAPIIASGSYNNSPVPAAGQAVGAYRLLRSQYADGTITGVTYTEDPPMAVAPSSYNRSEAVTDTRVAYGGGMADFCAACHPDMHTDSGNLLHPVDQNLNSTLAGNYGSYVGSGDMTGSAGTSFDSLVPFQRDNLNGTDFATLAGEAVNDGSVTTGPTANVDRVFCLTCHRAHASGWEYATRWDNEIELIIVDGEWPGTDATSTEARGAKWAKGRTQAERAKAYNDTPASDYATYQRSLCNKCHAKD
jgi:predicted CXXCH cytochrome family protein